VDLLLQFLDIHHGLLEDLELEFLFLPLLLALGGLLPGRELVVFIILFHTLNARGILPSNIRGYEIPDHRECLIDLGAPGLFDTGMVLAAHRFAGST
jgi:hypothetical protein